MAKNETKNPEPSFDEAKTLGIKTSKTSLSGFKTKGPADTSREAKKHEELASARTKNRITKAKAAAKMKPVDKRRLLLQGRFKAVRARTRPNTYTDAMIKAWIEELNVIQNNPKHWITETNNGKDPYPRPGKKAKTASALLDSMDLDA